MNRYVKGLVKKMKVWIEKLVLKHVSFSIPVRLDHKRYWIPIHLGFGAKLRSIGQREANVSLVIKILLANRKGSAIDIGANIGQTLLIIKHHDPDRHYVGFEPNPECASYLEQLSSVNHWRNVSIVAVGLSDRPRIATLNLRDDTSETSSIVSDFRPDQFYDRTVSVPVFDGDLALSCMDSCKEIAFIKIDVEGAELEVMKGIENTMNEYHPPILFEVLPDRIFMTGEILDGKQASLRKDLAVGIENILVAHGYSIYRIKTDGSLCLIKSLNDERDVPLSECNYVAVVDPESLVGAHVQSSC